MAILPIRLIGDPVLRAPADPVTAACERAAELVQNMFETMDEVDGVGLAAPQVGVGLAVFTYDDRAGHRGHCLNPSVEIISSDPAVAGPEKPAGSSSSGTTTAQPLREGCLSVPGMAGDAHRAHRVVLTGTTVEGRDLRIEAEGLLAAIFQHETDHLQGRLFVDRLTGEARKEAMRRLRGDGFSRQSQTTAQKRSLSVSTAFGAAASSSLGGTA